MSGMCGIEAKSYPGWGAGLSDAEPSPLGWAEEWRAFGRWRRDQKNDRSLPEPAFVIIIGFVIT